MPKQYHRFPGNDAHNFCNNNKHKNIMPLLLHALPMEWHRQEGFSTKIKQRTGFSLSCPLYLYPMYVCPISLLSDIKNGRYRLHCDSLPKRYDSL